MKTLLNRFKLPVIAVFLAAATIFAGCDKDGVTTPEQSDNEFLTSTAINTAYNESGEEDDNIFTDEFGQIESAGTSEDGTIDSLLKYGRTVTNVNVNASITFDTDTMKTVTVVRTITGNFIIKGFTAGSLDSVMKPYTENQIRLAVFKRVERTNNPRRNWRLYQFTPVDGQTTAPQAGKSNITIDKVELYNNNQLVYTINGPDFTNEFITTRMFGGGGVPIFNVGDNMKARVYLTSNQTETDIVAFHWKRNTFGFHRDYFNLVSVNGSSKIYEKEFTVDTRHRKRVSAGYISANTRSSLYSTVQTDFSSTYTGLNFIVR